MEARCQGTQEGTKMTDPEPLWWASLHTGPGLATPELGDNVVLEFELKALHIPDKYSSSVQLWT